MGNNFDLNKKPRTPRPKAAPVATGKKSFKTLPLYDTEKWGLVWREGAPSDDISDGRLALVILKAELNDKIEHYGDPVMVRLWGSKMKTTAYPTRINYDEVERWHPFPISGWPQEKKESRGARCPR